MKKEFNIGDRVRFTRDYDNECVCVDKGDCGTIERIDAKGILITLDNPEYVRIFDMGYIEPITPIAPKTAFLSDLKVLLEKYGAELGDSGMYEIEGMEVTFDNGDRIRYKHSTINALNIMDYDKK